MTLLGWEVEKKKKKNHHLIRAALTSLPFKPKLIHTQDPRHQKLPGLVSSFRAQSLIQ